jgi:hypothetical protein
MEISGSLHETYQEYYVAHKMPPHEPVGTTT